MPRIAYKIDTVTARDKLIPRKAIYWHKLDRGTQLGYQKLTPRSTGTWHAKFNNRETGERPQKPLGEFSDSLPGERFSLAKDAAEKWFAHLGKGGSTKGRTVRQACADYVNHVREIADDTVSGDLAANDLAGRYKRWIDNDPLGRVELTKLTKTQVLDWAKKLKNTPAKVSRHKKVDQETVTRSRSLATYARDVAALRSALNHAKQHDFVTSDSAWKVPLKALQKVSGQRTLYLDRDQRRALLDAAEPDIRTFLRGLTLLPFRPGALAGLLVEQFIPQTSTLVMLWGKDKAHPKRFVHLPPVTAKFFSEMVKGKAPTDPIFNRADGKRWTSESWNMPIKEAVIAAGLPPQTVAYTLRHSTITDLVIDGLPILTIAQIAGTSAKMIEEHYGHLRAGASVEALSKLAL
jgi:site-specific recombinase XerD